ncbi:MAG: hypothetical protein DMG72_10115 [Acidobacteria bacterium]|nr:MAG: hypothetical protein DMG72_10115 [Acidobacteriota bacterium]
MFNIEVNLCCGPVLVIFRPSSSISNSATAPTSGREPAASATAFPQPFLKAIELNPNYANARLFYRLLINGQDQ